MVVTGCLELRMFHCPEGQLVKRGFEAAFAAVTILSSGSLASLL